MFGRKKKDVITSERAVEILRKTAECEQEYEQLISNLKETQNSCDKLLKELYKQVSIFKKEVERRGVSE